MTGANFRAWSENDLRDKYVPCRDEEEARRLWAHHFRTGARSAEDVKPEDDGEPALLGKLSGQGGLPDAKPDEASLAAMDEGNGTEDEDEGARLQPAAPSAKEFKYRGTRFQEHFVVSGLLLPVWQAVENSLLRQHRQVDRAFRVIRAVTTGDAPRRLVGIAVPESALETLQEQLEIVAKEIRDYQKQQPPRREPEEPEFQYEAEPAVPAPSSSDTGAISRELQLEEEEIHMDAAAGIGAEDGEDFKPVPKRRGRPLGSKNKILGTGPVKRAKKDQAA